MVLKIALGIILAYFIIKALPHMNNFLENLLDLFGKLFSSAFKFIGKVCKFFYELKWYYKLVFFIGLCAVLVLCGVEESQSLVITLWVYLGYFVIKWCILMLKEAEKQQNK